MHANRILVGVTGLVVILMLLVFSSMRSTNLETERDLTVYAPQYVDKAYYEQQINDFNDRRKVYFFHASWCPTCRALENDIVRNIGSLPSDVSIIKVDFDTNQSLRATYGVTVQHTLVQVKADGTMIGKWVGQPSLQDVLADLQTL